MRLHDQKHGFTVEDVRSLPELRGTLNRLRHDRTGLELVWLEREEENKTFGIAFETLPWDDTGVFHILEHSVLCGSDKYPVKEPFVELLKSSMNTFLNAMTFPDKTFYPVSSRNEKDFMNLTRVYLDAVFHPLIYSKPEIFRQEGWHYEFDEDGVPSYKGVVFNEMKGAYASPDELTMNAMNRALFPDSPYRFESGGDPAKIPDLTYESFLDSHRRFYSPSNAYVFLDGALDVDAVLSLLDGEYLSGFPRGERVPPPVLQKSVDGGTVEVEYELGEGEDPERRTRLAWGLVIGTFADREKLTAVQILSEVLCGDNQAPLCRAVLGEELAESVTMQVIDGVAQPWVYLEVRNLADGDREKVADTLRRELERLAAEGLDRTALEAAMANLEFRMRERDFGSAPQGLALGIQALESWLYGGDPGANLEVGDLFDGLREKEKAGYFETLIREILLDNPHRCQVVLTPSEAAGEARRKLERDRLDRESAAWDDARRAELLDIQEKLTAWQASEDTPENLALLPRLELSDISPEPEALPTEVLDENGVTLLYHDVSAGGVVYFSLYFDADDCTAQELAVLSFLTDVLGELATEHYTGRALADRKKLLCGQMVYHMSVYRPLNDTKSARVKLCSSFSVLEQNVPAALELVREILTATRLTENETRELLRQTRTNLFQNIVMSGNSVAQGRLSAQIAASGVAAEITGGFAYYKWLSAQDKDWDWAALKEGMETLGRRVAVRDRLTMSVTGSSREQARSAAKWLADALPAGSGRPVPVALAPWGLHREGIAVPADVAFAVAGGDMADHGGHYSGELALMDRVVSLGYLWNLIRVQGGAYGTGMIVKQSGMLACSSYRDPDAARSLEKYLGAGEFLRAFCAEDPDLTGFIIGAVSRSEPLLSPRLKGRMADQNYWLGRTLEQRRAERREMLGATPEKLAALSQLLDDVVREGGVCVVGNREQLDACALDQIETL